MTKRNGHPQGCPFWFAREKGRRRRPFFHIPLYLRRVAIPPRMCRWERFSSSMAFTCVYSARSHRARRSDRSLCTVDLLTPNFLAAARTVVRFSIMYRASSLARCSRSSRITQHSHAVVLYLYGGTRADMTKGTDRTSLTDT